jgi:hypothetical protein
LIGPHLREAIDVDCLLICHAVATTFDRLVGELPSYAAGGSWGREAWPTLSSRRGIAPLFDGSLNSGAVCPSTTVLHVSAYSLPPLCGSVSKELARERRRRLS